MDINNRVKYKIRLFYIKVLLILLVITIWWMPNSLAMDLQLNFNRITNEDGLSQNTARTIIQDNNGYMWIGTDEGVNIYDGDNFEVLKYDKVKKVSSLSSSKILDLVQDSKNNIWIGTKEGLNKLDEKTKENKIYKFDSLNENGISNNKINVLMIDSRNRLWIGTEYGLNLYNYKNDSFQKFYKNESKISITDNRITAIEEDANGDIWVGTKDGLNCISKNLDDVKKYQGRLNKHNENDGYISSLCAENENLWIGTKHSGINKLNIKSKINKKYNVNTKEYNLLSNNIYVIKKVILNGELNILIGTNSGLNVFNTSTGEISSAVSSQCDVKSLTSNIILDVYQDKTGLIWIGTVNGISLYNSNNIFNHYKKTDNLDTLSSNMISGIYEDNEGLLWVGTIDGGVNCIDRKKDNKVIKKYNNNKHIWSIVGNKNDDIYWSYTHGVKKLNKKTNVIMDIKIPINNPRVLYFDKDDTLWIGGIDGLISISPENKIIEHKEILSKINQSFNKVILSIHEDKNGSMWFGGNIGLIRYDKNSKKIEQYNHNENDKFSLSSNRVHCMTSDSKGNIYIGTEYGINRFEVEIEKFSYIDENGGLPSNCVYGILIDDNDNPWISNNDGICKMELEEKRIIKFTTFDGLQGKEFNTFSYFKNKKGELFFGGNNGLNSFYPKDYKDDKVMTQVVIKDIKIKNKTLNSNNNLKLNYNENYFTINFFFPDYRETSKIEYKYKLTGLDKDWMVEKDLKSINYTEIPPGEYVFSILARNFNGKWSNPTEVKITIKTPPWKTNFAYVIYTIIILMVIIFLWNEFKMLDSLVKQKTYELNNKLQENEKLYKKIIKDEREKNNYFVNLSHELRTPLNVILSSLQLIDKLNDNKEDIPKNKIKYYVNVMNKNSNRLLRLINNIIDTSKIESGTYKVKFEDIDIVYLVEEVALSMKDLIENKGIELIVDPEIEEKIINCAPSEIERCIINLIGNAVKFTEADGRIEVKLFDLGSHVKISVKDTGIGIDSKYHKAIFNRFSQAYKKSTEEYGGSGLGLTLTKQLILLHGGEIKLVSNVGQGSEFIIILPVENKNI